MTLDAFLAPTPTASFFQETFGRGWACFSGGPERAAQVFSWDDLNAMLAMGASKPWPDALEAFTGERQMSGKAMVEYFAPLMDWLEEQNKGQETGW